MLSWKFREDGFLEKETGDIVKYSCDIGKNDGCKVVTGFSSEEVVSDFEENGFGGLGRGHNTDCSELKSKWERRKRRWRVLTMLKTVTRKVRTQEIPS